MHDRGQRIVHGVTKAFFEQLSDSVLIYSKTSLKKSGATLPDNIRCYESSSVPFALYNTNEVKGADYYVGFGGGTAIDIAKYLAKKNNAKCIAIPSMLSTNVFATDKVAEITPDGKFTVDGVLPSEIWLDNDLIMKSDEQNICGFADVFSIATALQDWMIANDKNKDTIDTDIFHRAAEILFDALHLVDGKFVTADNIYPMFSIICRAGYITDEYGNGRPESGSEHILAKEIEKQIKVHHGLAVTCGIAIMSRIQPPSFVESVVNHALKDLGLYQLVRKNIPRAVLYKAISSVKPRPDRYTIIDYHTNLDKDFFVKNADLLIEESELYG